MQRNRETLYRQQTQVERIDHPDLVVHADWGSDPKRRWMCVATRNERHQYAVAPPEKVGELTDFWHRLASRTPGPRVLVGFDFPIGLPIAYARLAGFASFRGALDQLGTGPWSDFYYLARTPGEISVHRPFYPYRPGGTKHSHLLNGLGVDSIDQLLRRCERRTSTRGPASPLFWTLGGKQVGRAAIEGWRGVIVPGLEQYKLKLWPFDGTLAELLSEPGLVATETYPAEACTHLGLNPPGRGWSKTSQEGRQGTSPALHRWADAREISLAPDLSRAMAAGFGPARSADDPFDAMLGLFSMLEVVLGHRPEGAPHDPSVRDVEGWILGQEADKDHLRLAV